MEEGNSSLINEAMPIFIGVGINPFPKVSDSRILAIYGNNDMLIDDLRKIIGELDNFDVDWNKMNLIEATDLAVKRVGNIYKFLDEKALNSLGWLYSFNYK